MKPFTYHLYHKPTGKHYYGVRYCKGCSPEDLWTIYYTSSPVVHTLIEQYGKESFVPTVRKIFDTADNAVAWETKFLIRVNAQHNDIWLNRHNGSAKFIGPHTHSEEARDKMSRKQKGKPKSEEHKAKIRAKAKVREEEKRAAGWKMPVDDVERRAAMKRGVPRPPEMIAKMAASKTGAKRQYLPDGSFIMVKPQQVQ
jgi:hypothetical protein